MADEIVDEEGCESLGRSAAVPSGLVAGGSAMARADAPSASSTAVKELAVIGYPVPHPPGSPDRHAGRHAPRQGEELSRDGRPREPGDDARTPRYFTDVTFTGAAKGFTPISVNSSEG